MLRVPPDIAMIAAILTRTTRTKEPETLAEHAT
jgi:hypothetical protein